MHSARQADRNLLLVHTEEWQDVGDFHIIKSLVEKMAPDIEVFVVENLSRSPIARKKAATRPSLIFSPIKLMAFRPARGKIYAGTAMSKLTEMGRLSAAGLPVPEFEEIQPGTRLSVDSYGPLVIVKPSYELASWGQGVELRRTDLVRHQPQEAYAPDHPGALGPMIAQRFIDCGRAMTFRVLTLFGEPIFTYCREATKPLALDILKDRFDQAEFMPAPPDRVSYISKDPDFLSLATRAYKAMPEIALQACDILRAKTGELYLLEINPGGGTWMFSSPSAKDYRATLGIDDLAAPFNAFQTCARLLVERTRAEAL